MGKSSILRVNGRELRVSNLEKMMYPAAGFTKAQVIDYYIKASKYILPHLKDRPLTLKRYPDGVTGEHFYEKNAPSHTPAWVQRAIVPRRGGKGEIAYVMLNDLPSLVWAANLASLELHVLLSRAPNVHQPTAIVFDLDPGDPADVLDCARVSLWIRELLGKLDLQSFVKSSGSKGLQLYVPLNGAAYYAQTKAFARAVAEYLQHAHPERVEAQMARELRKGKVFIDWSQNAEFKTTVCVYSLRAKRERPFVSMPFAWEEIENACEREDSSLFLIEAGAALERLEKAGDLFAPVLTLKQKVPEAFEKMLGGAKPPADNGRDTPRKKRPADRAGRSIEAYKAKRDFSRTAEPPPRAASSGGDPPLFVIQKHHARQLHYDLRLEMDGVLKSWAVPKGPPYKRAEKRLAMRVEDHPIEYARFEGVIAPGNYGAGTVMVWDIGTYELLEGSLAEGKLRLMLHGKKLNGEWILVRARKSEDEDKESWLLIKGGDSIDPPKNADRSALTRRTIDAIRQAADAEGTPR